MYYINGECVYRCPFGTSITGAWRCTICEEQGLISYRGKCISSSDCPEDEAFDGFGCDIKKRLKLTLDQGDDDEKDDDDDDHLEVQVLWLYIIASLLGLVFFMSLLVCFCKYRRGRRPIGIHGNDNDQILRSKLFINLASSLELIPM